MHHPETIEHTTMIVISQQALGKKVLQTAQNGQKIDILCFDNIFVDFTGGSRVRLT